MKRRTGCEHRLFSLGLGRIWKGGFFFEEGVLGREISVGGKGREWKQFRLLMMRSVISTIDVK